MQEHPDYDKLKGCIAALGMYFDYTVEARDMVQTKPSKLDNNGRLTLDNNYEASKKIPNYVDRMIKPQLPGMQRNYLDQLNELRNLNNIQ